MTTSGAEGADRLTPRARAYLWARRRRYTVGVGPRSKYRTVCEDLAYHGWLSLEWAEGMSCIYRVLAVPTPEPRRAPGPTPGTGGGNIRTMSAERAAELRRANKPTAAHTHRTGARITDPSPGYATVAHDHPPYERCGPSCYWNADAPPASVSSAPAPTPDEKVREARRLVHEVIQSPDYPHPRARAALESARDLLDRVIGVRT